MTFMREIFATGADEEARFMLGCLSGSETEKGSFPIRSIYKDQYQLQPIVIPLQKNTGIRTETIKCKKCGKEIVLQIKSEWPESKSFTKRIGCLTMVLPIVIFFLAHPAKEYEINFLIVMSVFFMLGFCTLLFGFVKEAYLPSKEINKEEDLKHKIYISDSSYTTYDSWEKSRDPLEQLRMKGRMHHELYKP